MQRLTFFWILCITWLPHADAADYYVSEGGDDAAAGSLSHPWRTMSRAAEKMREGDTCHIRAGVYRETVVPKSGQTFQAYRDEPVTITGNDIVTGAWVGHHDAILKTSVQRPVLDVFYAGVSMEKARWPDSSGDRLDTSTWTPTTNARQGKNQGKVSFTQKLPHSFVGGFYTGRNGNNCFNGSHAIITAQAGQELHCSQMNLRWQQGAPGHIGEGSGYITHHLNALSIAREWHWQEGVLYFYPPDGADLKDKPLEIRTRLWGFDCSGKSAVRIHGIHFFAASILMDHTDRSEITRCTFRYVSPWGNHRYSLKNIGGEPSGDYQVGGPIDGTSGIHINGNANSLRDCFISKGWGCLVTLLGRDSTIENCYLEDANWLGRIHTSPLIVAGHNQTVRFNTFRRSGGEMIGFIRYDDMHVTAVRIIGNDCRQYGLIMADSGTSAIYTNGTFDLQDALIAHNFIAENLTTHKRIACGIYLDDRSQNATIHHNIVDGRDHRGGGPCVAGLFTHRGSMNLRVFNNTFWNCTAGWRSAVWKKELDAATKPRDPVTMVYRNNLSNGPGVVLEGQREPGVSTSHSRERISAGELIDPEKLDFRIKDGSSELIDSGTIILGITDGFAGTAPDLGAIEHGTERHRCGWSLPLPVFPSYPSSD
jgi:hypothetical protein